MDVVPGLVGGLVALGMVIVRWWRGAVGAAAPPEWTTLPFARRRAIKAAVSSGRLVDGAEHEQRIAAELASGLLRRYGWGTRLRWGAFSGLYGVYWIGIGLYEGGWVRLALGAFLVGAVGWSLRGWAREAPRVERAFSVNFEAGYRTS